MTLFCVRLPIIAAVGLVIIASALFADEIILKDGTAIKGTIEKEADEFVVISTDNGSLTLNKSEILDIKKSLTTEEEYSKLLAALDNTAASRAELGAWCRGKKMYARMKKHFEEAVDLDPENKIARRGLGYEKIGGKWLIGEELLIAKGYIKFEGKWLKRPAIEEIYRARKQEASEYLRISKMPANSICIRSQHFSLLSDAPAPDLDNMLAALEGLRTSYFAMFDFEGNLKLHDSDDMAVCLFSDRDAYEKYAKQLKVPLGTGTYGYYASTEQKALIFRNVSNPSTMEMMLHESAHMLFTRSALLLSEWEEGGRLSAWFYEGLAEYFEASAFDNGMLASGRPHAGDLKRVQEALKSESAIPLAELVSAGALTDLCNTAALNTPRINLAYAESWSLVYFLLKGEDGKHRREFFRFFDRERRGKGGTVSAFKKIFGDPASLEEKWRKFTAEIR